MALALGRDNLRNAMMKGLMALQTRTHEDMKAYREHLIKRNVDLITVTKNEIEDLESRNEALSHENQELRQFSLDGYQLGNNVQKLTHEREILSVDLADKAKTVNELMQENERLRYRLHQLELKKK